MGLFSLSSVTVAFFFQLVRVDGISIREGVVDRVSVHVTILSTRRVSGEGFVRVISRENILLQLVGKVRLQICVYDPVWVARPFASK